MHAEVCLRAIDGFELHCVLRCGTDGMIGAAGVSELFCLPTYTASSAFVQQARSCLTASHTVLAIVGYGRLREIISEPWRLGGNCRPEQVLCPCFTQFMLNNENSAAPVLPHNALRSPSLQIEAAFPPGLVTYYS